MYTIIKAKNEEKVDRVQGYIHMTNLLDILSFLQMKQQKTNQTKAILNIKQIPKISIIRMNKRKKILFY